MEPQPNSDSPSLSAVPPVKRKQKAAAGSETSQAVNAKEIRDLIQGALVQSAGENKIRMYQNECAQAIIAVLNEFMPTYALIGYDFEGTSIKIINTHNALEADAIGTALQKLVMGIHFQGDD